MEDTLEVWLPAPKSLITQRFGENANGSYARDGLKGHTSYDWGMPWGAPIRNCTKNAYCYSVMHKDNPDPTEYRAIFFIVETKTGVYEISYGHCSTIVAQVGKTYQPGEVIGFVGNSGDVFSDHEVTKAERLAGSHAGAHLHGPQIRVLRKVKKFTVGERIRDAKGYLKLNGYYFEVPNYNNGYNGCVSLAPFSTETLASTYKPPVEQSSPVEPQSLIQPLQTAVNAVQELPVADQPYYLEVLRKIGEAIRSLFIKS